MFLPCGSVISLLKKGHPLMVFYSVKFCIENICSFYSLIFFCSSGATILSMIGLCWSPCTMSLYIFIISDCLSELRFLKLLIMGHACAIGGTSYELSILNIIFKFYLMDNYSSMQEQLTHILKHKKGIH